MKNINADILNRLEKSFSEQTRKTYNFAIKGGKSLSDVRNSKESFKSFLEKNNNYLKSGELFSDIAILEKGLLKIKAGNYQKNTFDDFRNRKLNEMIQTNQKAINNRMLELKNKFLKAEEDYNKTFVVNPARTELELMREKARIDLLSENEAVRELINIKSGDKSYKSEIELSYLLNRVPEEEKNTFRTQLNNIDPPWLNSDLKADLNEFNSLCDFPADTLPIKVNDGEKTGMLAIPIIEMLDDISDPDMSQID